MTIISERVKYIFKNKRLQKSRPEVLNNTLKFSKKYDVNIIDSRVDFLTIKIKKSHKIITKFENGLYKIQPSDYINDKNTILMNINNKIVLFNKFIVVFSGHAFNDQKQIYSIYDGEKNKIGQIILKNELIKKTNTNVINQLELKGLFFKCYGEYLDDFLKYFNIDRKMNGLTYTIDYCIDIKGIESFQILDYLKVNEKKSKNVNDLPAVDKKRFLLGNYDFEYGLQKTYKNFPTAHNHLKFYDKILDILAKRQKRRVNGVNPYQDYLDSDLPIARIELRKKKFTNLRDNSLDFILNNIESLFFDHLRRYLKIDLSLYLGCDITLNGKKTFLAKEIKKKSILHAYTMASAYLKSIKELQSEKELYIFLYKSFPELNNIKILDLVDEFAVSDYFIGISDDIIL